MLNPLPRIGRWILRGTTFKRWVRPNPPAEPGPRLRIAVCYLVPLLGDVVMLFPLLDALRRDQPDAEISVFVSGLGSILRLHPAVDHLYEKPTRIDFKDGYFPNSQIMSVWRWWKRDLRHLRFDVCVLPRGGCDPFYAVYLAWLLGGRKRVGFSPFVEPERRLPDFRTAVLLTDELTEIRGVHEVERGAEVLQRAGLLTGPVSTDFPSSSLITIATNPSARNFVTSHPQLSRPYFVISPGASHPRKEWPEEKYAAVAQQVADKYHWIPVIIGGPECRAAGDRIAAELNHPVLNLAGQTDFTQLAAVCFGARAFIGNDSGTGHVAGALATPAVIISSYPRSSPLVQQTSPARTHPAGPWYATLQPLNTLAPCEGECLRDEAHCIRQVEVIEVLESFENLLSRSTATRENAPQFAT